MAYCPNAVWAAHFLAMKVAVLALLRSYMALAKDDTPKYSCPEVDVHFYGNDLEFGCGVPGVVTWENCGMHP